MRIGTLSKRFSLLLLFLSCLACSATQADSVTPHFSAPGFIDQFEIKYPLKYQTGKNESGESISIEVEFTKTSRDQHYVIQILFSKPGSLLVESEYLAGFNQSKATQNPAQHMMNFPAVGSRAMYRFLGAGPGGAAEQLIFTSSDKRLDIKVLSSHLLPDSVNLTPIDIEKLAKYIDGVLLRISKH
ncbi:MAG: hypothetical protein OEZ39_16610 [Gammaproteobacteria bacterium]|nr:hypothetical protein [Gammaproteobacteria bacterium]MDH5653483.1 hypothetical protein [Gammaproteobacteria bacterium]